MITAPHSPTSIRTYHGSYLDLLDPQTHHIEAVDIYVGLSRCCRYARQCHRWYSVAEHSWLISAACLMRHPSLFKEDPEQFRLLQLRALLHDASEAYLGDMPSPIKKTPEMAGFRSVENRLQRVIYDRFGVDVDDPHGHEALVHQLDIEIRNEEKCRIYQGSMPASKPVFNVTGFDADTSRLGFQLALEFVSRGGKPFKGFVFPPQMIE